MLHNIPTELRAYNSFVLWRFEERGSGKPTKVPYSVSGKMANVNESGDWTDFETAVTAYETSNGHYAGIGFVLSDNDPFAFIDLDDPYDETKSYSPEQTKEVLDRQVKIHEMFNTYSERSPSGKGLHILCKGKVAQGRRRAQVEVYSNQRFMTVTGDVYNGAPIEDRNELLNELWSEMGKNVKVYNNDFLDKPETMDDNAVCDMAAAALNGMKFCDLYKGFYQSYYSSQSEADFALIDIIAFYTQNRAQIMRIFRKSALGERGKAFRDDYLNTMILRSFDHQLPPINIEGLRIQLEAAIMARAAANSQALIDAERIRSDNEALASAASDTPLSVPVNPPRDLTAERYPPPPGLMGDIVSYIQAAATRPVYEIALGASIGLMSGICGRAYNVSGTGLNQYTVIIAPTGTGKEAAASGIDKLMNAVSKISHNCKSFIGPGDISSAQALGKHFHRHSKSFVAMPGEIGLWLQRICGQFAGPADAGVKRALLQLFSVSGQGQTFKATINSAKENSTDETLSPALSILGETTPSEFYKILDDAMVLSGLMPRFNLIEYRGKRPARNKQAPYVVPSDDLVQKLATVCTNAISLNELNVVVDVGYTDDALALLDKWDNHCDTMHRSEDNPEVGEVQRELWNRGHLKALKLAALVSVGMNPYQPVINLEAANWAINIVNGDIEALLARFNSGEIGSDVGESKQINEFVRVIRDYLLRPFSSLESYGVRVAMHSEKIIPFTYISRRLGSAASFKGDRMDASGAIKKVIQIMLDRGDIVEVQRGELKQKFDTTARAFMVAVPRTFGI